MAPRVLVDATAVPADRGGVGRYVDGLIAALDAADADLAVACQRSDAERYGRVAPSARIVAGPAAISHRPARLAWEQTGLPMVAQQVQADVVHSPHYTLPLRAGRPVVVTLHDATFFTEPDMHTAVKGTFFRSATRTAIRRAARCLVPSKATRDELVRIVDADATKLDVAYHGVDTSVFRPPTPAEAKRVRARLGLGDGAAYVGFLGTIEPRKNVPNLIRGWVSAFQADAEPPALVLVGGAGWDDDVDAAVARRAVDAAPAASRLPAARRPARLPRRGERGRLPEPRRGLRPAGARGDGLRRRGADHASGSRCPRSAATRSPTPSETPRRSRRACARSSTTSHGARR